MIAFHGCNKPLIIENKVSERYKILVLFFTTEQRLAKMYGDKIYKVNLQVDKTIDFKGQISHSRNFRNLVYQMSREGRDVVEVTNIYDRPNDCFHLEKSTIYIVYDLEKIQNLEQCT